MYSSTGLVWVNQDEIKYIYCGGLVSISFAWGSITNAFEMVRKICSPTLSLHVEQYRTLGKPIRRNCERGRYPLQFVPEQKVCLGAFPTDMQTLQIGFRHYTPLLSSLIHPIPILGNVVCSQKSLKCTKVVAT